jgi:hypothetical protein
MERSSKFGQAKHDQRLFATNDMCPRERHGLTYGVCTLVHAKRYYVRDDAAAGPSMR